MMQNARIKQRYLVLWARVEAINPSSEVESHPSLKNV